MREDIPECFCTERHAYIIWHNWDPDVHGDPDYGGVSHILRLEKEVFELRRRHLEAIHFDQLLYPELAQTEEIS